MLGSWWSLGEVSWGSARSTGGTVTFMKPRPSPRIATSPVSAGWIDHAVETGGGSIVDPADATAVVWTKAADPNGLASLLAANEQIEWVQLPWAGIEPYVPLLGDGRVWTCAKGVYADPVAEHGLALMLAGLRHISRYSTEQTWTRAAGRNLIGASVTIIGGGGIARALIEMLVPLRCRVTVVRRRPEPMEGTVRVLGADQLLQGLTGADVVVLALPLVGDTIGLIGATELAAMEPHTWLINVARGAHVQTDALVHALSEGIIGGAGLDVTDPEPLPDGHLLWALPNAIITPHTGNTPEMAKPLLGARITDNVARYAAGRDLVGLVDTELGY